MKSDIADKISGFLTKQGCCLVGFADLENLQLEARKNFPRGIVIAMALNPSVVDKLSDGPFPAYVDEYHRLNKTLDEITDKAVRLLENIGCKAVSIPASGPDWDRNTLITPLPHKTLATLAGLGWIGKCALLITQEFGAAIRLGSILTDAELPTGNPVSESLCGTCNICVDACPGSAPSGTNWKQGIERSDFFDAHTCRQTIHDIGAKTKLDTLVCGICINACPWTQKFISKSK